MSSADADSGRPSTGSIQRPRRRVPFWDNARYACIVLVVLGHAIQRLIYDSDIAFAFYLTLYAFHMPAFAIISGYFSKGGPPTRVQMARVITDWVPSVLAGATVPSQVVRGVCMAGHKALYSDEWGGLPDKEFLGQLAPELADLRDRLYEKACDASVPAGNSWPRGSTPTIE